MTMRYLRLIGCFMRASLQEETAHRANLAIALLHSLLNLATGVVGVAVLMVVGASAFFRLGLRRYASASS